MNEAKEKPQSNHVAATHTETGSSPGPLVKKHTRATGKRRANWRIINTLEDDLVDMTRSRDRWRFIFMWLVVVVGVPSTIRFAYWVMS